MNSIAKLIDYTLLKATAISEDVEGMCREALDYKFASICIQPVFVELCARLLAGSEVGVTTVIGFPFGATKPETKAFEATQAVSDGATEVDMVMNIGEMLSGNLDVVQKDIETVVKAVAGRAVVKVIIETAFLSPEQIAAASKIVKASGADFVKTSTGYGPGGAKIEDIRIIREAVGPDFGIKASGGISSYQTAKEMMAAGATRFGASAAIKIVQEEKASLG